jgi:heme/copper-type cytochrome/quinol oxidase subunit 2
LLVELKGRIVLDMQAIENLGNSLKVLEADLKDAAGLQDYKKMESIQKGIDEIKSGAAKDDLEASIKRKTKQVQRIEAIKKDSKIFASTFTSAALDDVIAQEIHLALDSMVTFDFRSKDIIHSAWLPHFRVQMNIVPGMPTKFTFRPTKTTAEAKAENGPDFDYYLYCNKICGVSHFNMKIKVVIETQAEVDAWMKTQQPVFMKKIETPVVPAVEIQQDSTKMNADTTLTKKLALK